MRNGSPIRLVCFDLGGVLIRICRTWAEGCRAARLDVRRAIDEDSIERRAWHAVAHEYQLGNISCEAYAQQLSAALEGLYSPDEIMAIHRAWMHGEYEGVGDVIDRIHQAGLETAALSNTNHAHWLQINTFPAVMKLRHRLASHELRLHKPDPAVYLEAEQRFGRQGNEILFFDDLPENIDAARAAGWNAVQIDPHERTDAQIEQTVRGLGLL